MATEDRPSTLPPALPWASTATPTQPPKPGDTIEVLWEIEQEDEVLRVWWPAEVLPLAEGQSLDNPARTIRYEEGEGWAPEETTVRFSASQPTLVDAQGNELDWRMEGCPSPATRAAEAAEAVNALREHMTERGLDAAQQAAMAERLREFVQRLTGDASHLAAGGEIDAAHVMQAAEAFVKERKGHGELEAFVRGRLGGADGADQDADRVS